MKDGVDDKKLSRSTTKLNISKSKRVKPSGDISLFHHCLDNTNSFNNNIVFIKGFFLKFFLYSSDTFF